MWISLSVERDGGGGGGHTQNILLPNYREMFLALMLLFPEVEFRENGISSRNRGYRPGKIEFQDVGYKAIYLGNWETWEDIHIFPGIPTLSIIVNVQLTNVI